MSITCLQGGRVIDPVNGVNNIQDLYFQKEKIIAKPSNLDSKIITTIDVSDKIIFPGLVDLRFHLKNITGGQTENILSASHAAAAGGYTSVLLMPDTTPKPDNPGTIQFIQDRILKEACVKIHLCGNLTQDGKGEQLAPLGSLQETGVIAITDCPNTTQNNQIFSKGVEYASMFGLLVIDLPRDISLSKNGSAHDGPLALKMGLGGYPRIAEELYVQRAISIAQSIDTKIHLTSISSKGSVELIKSAKDKGIKISADVTANHLCFNENCITGFNPNFKMSPPIREEIDRLSLVDALLEGTIDCVSTAHNPFQEHEKNVEYDLSPAGVISFETNLSSCYQTLKENKEFCWTKLIKAMSSNPSRILEIDSGNLSIDMPADIAIFDPNIEWEYGSREGVSQATNSPFEKHLFKGKIMQTFVNGKIAFELK